LYQHKFNQIETIIFVLIYKYIMVDLRIVFCVERAYVSVIHNTIAAVYLYRACDRKRRKLVSLTVDSFTDGQAGTSYARCLLHPFDGGWRKGPTDVKGWGWKGDGEQESRE